METGATKAMNFRGIKNFKFYSGKKLIESRLMGFCESSFNNEGTWAETRLEHFCEIFAK